MSHWVQLAYKDNLAQVESHEEGGTFALGGSTNAELNVTYNYGPLIRMAAKAVGWDILTKGLKEGEALPMLDLVVQVYVFADEGIAALHGKKAEGTVAILRALQERLGTNRHDDYWAPTPGNAGYALMILADWAEQHPNATWSLT